jgi:ABC-2 type transport system permease protein
VIAVELLKQVRRRSVWLTLAVMAAVPALLTAVIGLTRPALAERVGNLGAVVTDSSEFTMPLIALNAMLLFLLPLAVAVFAGEAVAAEAGWGSLRYLLIRPVSRTRVLAAKAAVAAGLSATAVAVACMSALAVGALAFGWRPLTVLDLQHTTAFHLAVTTFPPETALARLLFAWALILGTVASTFAFTLLLSTLTDQPFSAVAGGVGLGLVSRALDNVPGLHALGPWLPVTDAGTTLWTGVFFQPADLAGLPHLALLQAFYTAVFLAAAWLRFTRVDVLSDR